MTESHGSSGDIGEGSSSRFSAIRYVLKINRIKILEDDWKIFKEIEKRKIHLILGVKFSLQENSNINLHKRSVQTIDDWLRTNAYQRVCFIGKRRDMMVRWERPKKKKLIFDKSKYIENEEEWETFLEAGKKRNKYFHKDPHFCSRFCLWFQADVCTVIYRKWFCLCTEKIEKYEAIVSLSETNRFVPQVYPIFTVFLQDQVNFEKIIQKATVMQVKKYYEKIKKFHKEYGGRTEIRYGGYLFIDVSIPLRLVEKYIEMIPEGSYHLGKYQPPNNQLQMKTSKSSLNFKLKI